MDFLERKPQLKEVLNNPYVWQEFVRKKLLNKVADNRTDGILMKIDNLDRMELTLIKKIENYRMKQEQISTRVLFEIVSSSSRT